MSEEPKARVRMEEWKGQVSNADAGDLPPGATQSQVNFRTRRPGLLEIRYGLKPAEFEN